MTSSPAVPYVLPFGVFVGLLLLFATFWQGDPLLEQWIRVGVMIPVVWFVAGPVLDFRIRRWGGTIAVGVLTFAVWIAPDLLFPGYRHSRLFENVVMGQVHSTLPFAARQQPMVLALRTLRAVMIVPIVEELFWRGWLARWVIAADFRKVAFGAFTWSSFCVVAVLFAAEHGPYWDVGLLAGILLNWWMVRSKSLGDLILAHAIANACLSAYVITAGKWEYWQ